MKILVLISILCVSALATASSNNGFFTRMAVCTGWPHEGGTGTIEFFRDLRTMDETTVLVRTDHGNNHYGSVNLSGANADNSWSTTEVTIWAHKDHQNLTSAFRVVIKPGKAVKTPYYRAGKYVTDLSCDSNL